MNAVQVDQMKNPARDYPKAIFLAMVLVLAIFIVPALVISWVIPAQQISLTAGVMQAFSAFFAHFGLNFMVPLIAIAMVIAMLSGMMAWLAGPSKGLLLIGRQYGYLPPYLQKVNEEGIQMHILVVQGIVVTIVGLLYALIPSVSSAYWIFSVMTTQVYLIMYVLMFIAAIRLRRKAPSHPRGYKAPALITQCVVGSVASVLAFLIGFVPPSQFSHSSPVLYGLLILSGILVLGVLPPLLLYRFRKPSWKSDAAAPALTGASANGPPANGAPANAAAANVAAATGSAATDTVPTPAPPTAHDVPVAASAGDPTDGAAVATANGDGNGAAGTATSAAASAASDDAAAGGARRGHQRLVWGIGALVLVLAVAAVLIYKHGRNDQLARTRADRVIALFAADHLAVPVDHSTLIDVLGTDGGPVCASPGGALTKALEDLQLSNGAATVGARPIRADRSVVAGEQLVLSVYCPQKLPTYQKYVNGNAYYPVIRR